MVLKTRKFGVKHGRTVRSSFGISLAKRSEGLLIQTLNEGKQDEEQSVTYSLGKQNRWLLPEVIKTGSVEKKQSEDVVLVERYTSQLQGNERSNRPDCFSVFNSTDGTTRESKRRSARVEDLLSHSDSMKTRYEVTYPHPSGIWSDKTKWSTRKQTAHFNTRKKSSIVNWTIEEDFEEIDNPDPYLSHQDDEDDFSDFNDLTCQSYSSNTDRSLTFHLESFITSTSQKAKKSHKKKSRPLPEDGKGCKSAKGKAIYVESDVDGMHDAHEEFLAQIQETSSPVMDDSWQEEGGWGQRGGGWRWRGGRRGYHRGSRRRYRRKYRVMPPSSDVPTGSMEPVETALVSDSHDDCQCFLLLNHQETSPASLEKNWGEKYKEAACFPRVFILDATPEDSQSNSEELFVLFRLVEDCLECDAGNVKARVSTVVVCSDENAHESVLRKFNSSIQMNNARQKIWSLQEVVNIAMNCFQSVVASKTVSQGPRKPILALDMFTELFGWKSETFSLEMAQQEVKNSMRKKNIRQAVPEAPPPSVTMVSVDHCQQTECVICFLPFGWKDSDATSSHTSLNTCGHKFCDDCWRAHLRTQIQLNHTDLQCPGHECTIVVDDVTLMLLLPSWYGRYCTNRLNNFLEISPEWKWCPADQCQLVVKATTSSGPSVACDENAGSVHPSSVPVACVCGTMWCFKCQEDAHWPATCEEALVFRQKTKGYAEMLKNSPSASLITSVQVKSCPFCHYPIEKGFGCNHMVCGLCNEEFCWDCLEKWEDHGCECKAKVKLNEVELATDSKHWMTYEHFAVTSHMERSISVIRDILRKLDKLDKKIQFLEKFSSNVKEKRAWSGSAKNNLNLDSVQELRQMFSLKFQASFALEGLAIVLSFSKNSPNKRLVSAFERLVFIVERMDDMLQDANKCFRKETLERLKCLAKYGKECFLIISKCRK